MGTNYYVETNLCDCCGRFDELHIGKSSAGWAFSFRGYREHHLTSWQQWKAFLKGSVIRDEYNTTIDYDKFVTLVETFKCPTYVAADGRANLVHNAEMRLEGWFDARYDWDDEAGYSFSSREFS